MKRQKSAAFAKIKKRKNAHKSTNDKNYCQVGNHCYYTGKYRGGAHNVCNLECLIPERIHVAFHKRLNYDYNFNIKEIEKQSEGESNCLVQNAEKYKIF